MTAGQKRVWDLLEHRALNGKELVKAIKKEYDAYASEVAIRQQVRKMKNRGYKIENTPGRGYWRPDARPPDMQPKST